MRRLLCCLLAALGLLLLTPGMAWAQVHQHESEEGVAMVRSLESLRDLDYKSWQAVAYREGPPGKPVVLRVCLLYTSPSPRDGLLSRMPSSA